MTSIGIRAEVSAAPLLSRAKPFFLAVAKFFGQQAATKMKINNFAICIKQKTEFLRPAKWSFSTGHT